MNSSRTLPGRGTPRLRQWLVAALTFVLSAAFLGVGGLSPASADSRPADPADPATPVTVTADELSAPQINGVVWTMAMVGDTVYVGGSFSNARPAGSSPGQNTVPRANMMAFDVTTGEMTSFAPTFNQQVRTIAASPDGRRLYVGGDFTSVNGQPRQRIAAFDTATGALVQNFAPPVNYHVRAIVATNSTVYVGGNFGGVGNVNRRNLAAFNASNGALLDWAPQATGGIVDAITINPEGTKVAVGGGFTALNGSSNPGYGLGMVDAVTGASLPFEVNEYVRNGTTDGAIDTLATDGTNVYGGGWTYGKSGGTWEGVFSASWDDGKVNWLNDCHGDTYGVYPVGDVVYVANHAHYCENIDGMRQGAGGVGSYPYHRAIAFGTEPVGTASWEPDQRRYYSFEGQPHSAHLGWFPNLNTGTYTGQYQGPWSVVGNSDYVVFGGEFTRVNGTNQQGLVRFTTADKAPNRKGPSLFNATYPLNVTSTEAGKVRVNWSTNQDIDNENLTYRVYRDSQNGAGLIHTRSVSARYWNPYTMGFTDTGLTPGATHRYRVAVTDPFGNIANSPWTDVTVATSGTNSDYVEAVYTSEPTNYWRMGESSGSTISDTVGFNPLNTFAGATLGAPGAIVGDDDTAARFSGASGGMAATVNDGHPPDVFTIEAWFNTTTTRGGRLIGWSNRNTDRNSSKHDRQLYMDNSGRIHFGVKPNASRVVVSSTGSYNDGEWHHAVATLSKDGMTLYLDGEQVAARDDVTVGEHLAIGYWRIGGDTMSGWPSAPSSGYFAGSIDEVAVYKTALDATAVATHYAAATGNEPPNVAPVAAFEHQTDGLGVSVDGSASSDPDGTVTSYEWDFGDGGSATGVQAAHTYEEPGVYEITLTVTDDDGATRSVTQEVAVTTPPVADFTATLDGARLDVDASASTDDEEIVSYRWDFGDSGTATGVTASHTYTGGGTFDVTLTVTDNRGETGSVTREVTVVAPNVAPVAVFSMVPDGLSVEVDGSGSSDADGTVTSYAWDFGDGGGASGVTASHTYGEAGTYEVTLTVTDDEGATASLTQEVSVSAEVRPVAVDAFGRSVSNGWGSADVGGVWTRSGTASNFSVVDGVGRIRMGSPGAGPGMRLADVSTTDTDLRVRVGADKAPTGGGTYFTLQPRVLPDGDRYYVNVRQLSTGGTQVVLGRAANGVDGVLAAVPLALEAAPGELLQVRAEVTGTSPTTVRAKVWADGTSEPEDWAVSATDSTAKLQAPGGVGLRAYLSGSATNAPIFAMFDDLWAGSAGSEPPNAAPVAAFELETDELAVSVDGSGSSDPDGQVTSYVWDFGDGGSATGVTASHTYAEAGTYEVTLTVTDDAGATAEVTREVTVAVAEPPNAAPVAAFELETDELAVSVDGSGSSDPDGQVTSYVWDFGDGGSATGVTASHTYAEAGTYEVTLTVTDDAGATAEVTREVTVAVAGTPNVAPVAVFSMVPDGLSVEVDGSGSSDADGTVTSYAWDFGDGGGASGVTASHTYGEAGTYEVTLTVTDDEGATASLTQEVSVSAEVRPVAVDAFGRSVSNGWGSADVGGVWTRSGTASNFSVVDGVGRIRMGSPGAGPGMRLADVSTTDTDLRVRVGADKAPTGGGTYLTVQPRVLANGDRYFTDVRELSTGGVQLIVGRAVGGSETNLRATTVPGLTAEPGELVHLRTQAVGAAPTTLRAKVWADGTPEPDGWSIAVTDSTAALQTAGGIGLRTYLSGSATNAPVMGLFDELWVGPTP